MIIQQFEKQAEVFAEKPAVVTEKRKITFKELNQQANRVAHVILKKDKTPEHKPKQKTAALFFEHGVSMVIGVIAALKAEKIYVPIDINYPENRILYMLEESEAAFILTNNKNQTLVENLVTKVKVKPAIINIDSMGMDATLSTKNISRQPSGERTAYILYTSGSTGKPKGVVQNNENVLYYIRNWIQRFSLNSSDRMTLFSAFSHDGAGQDIFGSLLSGATLYPYSILNRTTIAGLIEWLQNEKITIWHSVPTLYRYFIHALKQKNPDKALLPNLRFILLGGEQLRQNDLEMFQKFFPNSRLANVYGQTESSVSTIWTVQSGKAVNRILLGEPLDKTKIFLKDRDGEIVEDIGTGEIYVNSPHLAIGYWKDSDKSLNVFLQDPTLGPVYRTGDLGRLLGDGTIEFMGRKDTQIKIRGFRVETGEIENRLLKYEGIKEAIVIARHDENKDDQLQLCAYIVPKPNHKKTSNGVYFPVSNLRNYLMAELPEYMIPSHFIEMEVLPLTPSGKVDRKALPAPESLRPQLDNTYIAPQTSIQKSISTVWQEVLNLDKVGIDDNFFDLGGTSFDILKIISHLHELLQMDIPVVSIFRYPTIRLFSDYLKQEKTGQQESIESEGWHRRRKRKQRPINSESMEIAVIGMAGRFPGSADIDEFWDNLSNGRETITFFSTQELINCGNEQALIENPDYIKANGIINEIEFFDAAFFNYSPAEAEMMDPQLRILHECTWEALENSGYNPDIYDGLIGMYVGNSPNHYWVTLTYLNQGNTAETLFLNNNYSTKVSYKLNLQGPSVVVQTACSTSLTAIHLASQSLLNYECDIAIAGGVSISLPAKAGYLYQEGMILAPDGHCRTFSDNSGGTVFGDGVGIVVLKRKEEAQTNGDNINAIIKSTASNNDGKRKVGVTAPSVEGQAEVIRAAIELAKIEPENIGYIETHGTGTLLGDNVEIEALKLAFNTKEKKYCALGSVKTNVGHLNSAAGVAGFIKTVLTLKNKLIPPSLHYEKPNPEINFKESPFYVNTRLTEWNSRNTPLRAGVSSFGIGGTNVHVVLEEAPERKKTPSTLSPQLILLSAKTQSALEQMTINLKNHWENNPHLNLSDISYTLKLGRKAFKNRKMWMIDPSDPSFDKPNMFTAREENRLIFMFSGQGSQYVNMGLDIFRTEHIFKEEISRCFKILIPIIGYDLKEVLYPEEISSSIPKDKNINQTEITQPIIFAFEYAMAKLLMYWGLKPQAMIGHSIGEYVAACLSGVISLEEALKLVAIRGKLMQQIPTGAMLSVTLPEAELIPSLNQYPTLSLAAVNAPNLCVISGPDKVIETFENQLKEEKINTQKLHTSHAFHSQMMEPILTQFEQAVKEVELCKPQLPYVSNLTGQWITDRQAMSSEYWKNHLRKTVRFMEGLTPLLEDKASVFIELGPGRSLTTFVQNHHAKDDHHIILNLVKHPQKTDSDDSYLLEKIGRLWLSGTNIDWENYYYDKRPQRVPLPTYPFEKEFFWLKGNPLKIREGDNIKRESTNKQSDIAKWFYVPIWKPIEISTSNISLSKDINQNGLWVLFVDDHGIGEKIKEKLEQQGQRVIIVNNDTHGPMKGENAFTIHPNHQEDYNTLLKKCLLTNQTLIHFVHLWNVTGAMPLEKIEIRESQEFGYYSLLNLVQAIDRNAFKPEIRLTIITDGMQKIRGDDIHSPQKATLLGALKVISKEYTNIQCQSIDIEISDQKEVIITYLLKELLQEKPTLELAYRDGQRWEKTYESRSLYRTGKEKTRLKEEGVYLITGGLGGIGMELAQEIATMVRPKLALLSRRALPPRKNWTKIIKSTSENDSTRQKIIKIKEIEKSGAKVLDISADVTNKKQMQKALTGIKKKWGKIDAVIHAAGIADGIPIRQHTEETSRQILEPKVTGALILEELLKDQPLNFFILFSSIGSILALPGRVAYSAANTFLDQFAHYKNAKGCRNTISINWDEWRQIGMTAKMQTKSIKQSHPMSILPHEGKESFMRILSGHGFSQVIVSTNELNQRLQRIEQLIRDNRDDEKHQYNLHSKKQKHFRPELSTPFVKPVTSTELTLVKIWQDLLKIESIGIQDDFFELGGDSLKAITFAGRIQNILNIDTPISIFFNNPTIKELANYLDKSKKTTRHHSITPIEKKEYYGLSSSQKRLYILQKMESAGTGYNLTSTILLDGPLEKDNVEKILWELVTRHESLRTSFHMVNGKPRQMIHENVEFKIEYFEIDPIQLKKGNGAETPIEQCISSFVRPFKLNQAPLMRVGLIRENENRHILILDMHHIIYDGESIQIFFEEFIDIYQSKELLPLKIQYKDYADWKNNRWNQSALSHQEKYWLDMFSGEIPILEIPSDYPRPAIQSFEGKSFNFAIKKMESQYLNTVAKEKGITPFMAILAIINIMFMKLSGQEDIVIGTPISGREDSQLERIIGIFVSTIALRNTPRAEKTVGQFLEELKLKTLKSFENQAYPFEELVEKVGAERDTSRNPLFDVMLIMHNYEVVAQGNEEIEIENLKVKKYPYDPERSRFDITFNVIEVKQSLNINIEYCTKIYKEKTIRQLAAYIQKILSIFPNILNNKIKEIDIIPKEERVLLLETFNQTEAEIPKTKCYHCLFQEQAKIRPHSIALSGASTLSEKEISHSQQTDTIKNSITYRNLEERANALALKLRKKGVKKGTLIGILVNRTLDMTIGLLAILKSGGAYLPLDPEYPPDRIQYILSESNTNILLRDRANKDQCNISGIIIEPSYDIKNSNRNSIELSEHNLAYVIYTSGSTGNPKGVMVSHENVVNFITAMNSSIEFKAEKRILAVTTVSFDIFFLEALLPLAIGMRVILAKETEQKDPGQLENLIIKNRVEMVQFTPSRLQLLYDLNSNLNALNKVEIMMVGGEAFPSQLLEIVQKQFRGKIYNMYGPTETTIWSTVKNLTNTPANKITIGTPIINTKVYIVNKNMQLQPLRVVGELLIGGLGLAQGYLNNIELTREKFIETHEVFLNQSPVEQKNHSTVKFYKTGDLTRWNSKGEIEFLGRIDFQVKIRGYRIELEEIEEQLLLIEEIKDAVVIVREEANGKKQLSAYIVPNPSQSPEKNDISHLRDLLANKLPQYMVPNYFIPIQKIPLTPNGKIDRNALPEPEHSQALSGNAKTFVAPHTDNEKIIAEIWKEILNLDEIGIHDNFFELGGNSLQVVQLNWKLKEVFGKEIPIEIMFRNLSISFIDQYFNESQENQKNNIKDEAMETAQKTLKDTISKLTGE